MTNEFDAASLMYEIFNASYYNKQVGEYFTQHEGIEHYFKFGASLGFDPHPLFSTRYYLDINPDVCECGINPLLHYCQYGWLECRVFSVLFDNNHYMLCIEKSGLKTSGPLLVHYLRNWTKHKISPSPFFDIVNYIRNYEQLFPQGLDPLSSYLAELYATTNPGPRFDTAYYLQTYNLTHGVPLVDFIITGKVRKTSPDLDLDFYVVPKEVENSKISKSECYLKYGFNWGSRPNMFASQFYYKKISNIGKSTTGKTERRLLFINHCCDNTGSSRSLLAILKSLPNTIEATTIFIKSGSLWQEFSKYSNVHCTNTDNISSFNCAISSYKKLYGNDLTCVVNSAGVTTDYLESLKVAGFKITLLFREMPTFYKREELDAFRKNCTQIIFNSSMVKNAFTSTTTVDSEDKLEVLTVPKEEYFNHYTSKIENIFFKMNKIDDSCIVITSCGTADFRKGFDRFLEVAALFFRDYAGEELRQKVHFVWIGEIPNTNYDTASFWGKTHLKNNYSGNNILFTGAVSDPRDFFSVSDIYLHTARVEPFGRASLEAISASLPVISFSEHSGFHEILSRKSYIKVDQYDFHECCRQILSVLNNPEIQLSLKTSAALDLEFHHNAVQYVDKLCAHMAMAFQVDHPGTQRQKSVYSRPSILFTNPTWTISGVNTFTETLCTELISLGYDAEIVFTKGPLGNDDELFKPNVPSVDLFGHYVDADDPCRITSLREYISGKKDVIIVPNYDFNLSKKMRSLPSKVGIVGVVHSDDDDHYNHLYTCGHSWDHIIGVSDYISRRISAINPAFTDKTSTIHYGVDTEKFKFAHRELFSAKKIQLLYTGRFTQKQKRIFNYVELCSKLFSASVDFHLTMIGGGEDTKALIDKMAFYISHGFVTIIDRISSECMRTYYQKANFFVLLSEYEGLSLSLLESMSSGCVPLVFRTDSGVPDVLNNSINGIVASYNDYAAICDFLKTIDSNVFQQMSTAASQKIISGFSISQCAKQYSKTFEKVYSSLPNKNRVKLVF